MKLPAKLVRTLAAAVAVGAAGCNVTPSDPPPAPPAAPAPGPQKPAEPVTSGPQTHTEPPTETLEHCPPAGDVDTVNGIPAKPKRFGGDACPACGRG